ncbi:MAG: ornithine cyclodeaminase family protein [Gemmatimonadetes bacterium]|nr:ornithine cyclodeaminase family protein [Gemmatimonadota bacterium]
MTMVFGLEAIKRLITTPPLIQAIEDGFVLYSDGKVVVPPVGFLHFDQPPGDVHIKYGYVRGDDIYVLKMASGFYDNAKLGVPVTDGVILVFSQQTGHLKMLLHDECWLTDMRTAAAGAVAARYLAPKNVRHIGIVGTGVQARMQLTLLRTVVDCRSCFVWGRDTAKVQAMIEDLNADASIQDWGLKIKAASDIGELASECRLIVTTTSAREALIRADQVQAGTHITAMGSDDHGKQELEAALLGKADRVVADSIAQCVDHGECFHAVKHGSIRADSILELGNVIKNPALGRTNDEQITVADLTGIAIQDIQIAKMVTSAYSKGDSRGG